MRLHSSLPCYSLFLCTLLQTRLCIVMFTQCSCLCVVSVFLVCLLAHLCACEGVCVYVWRLLSVTGGKLSIISFNYPEHSERPKLTPRLSSGC